MLLHLGSRQRHFQICFYWCQQYALKDRQYNYFKKKNLFVTVSSAVTILLSTFSFFKDLMKLNDQIGYVIFASYISGKTSEFVHSTVWKY